MALSDGEKHLIDHQFYDIINPANVFAAKQAQADPVKYLRGISAGPYSIASDGKNLQEASDYWRKLADARLLQLEKKINSAHERKMQRARLAERRLLDDQPVNHAALYRKMSIGEWRAMFAEWGEDHPQKGRYENGRGDKHILFKKAFEYTNTKNYRLWFSTSLMKCRKFDNVNATQSDDVIMRFWFSETAKDRFMRTGMLPHKQRGVQNNPDVVAWHREEFAEEEPNIDSTEVMKNRLALPMVGGHEVKRHYNLGFTSNQEDWLKRTCVSAEPMY